MAVEWFCKIMGSEVGPLTQDQLVDMVRNHRVNPEDLVRRNRSQWVPAFEVRGLFEAAAKPMAQPRVTRTDAVGEPAAESPSAAGEEPLWTNADVGRRYDVGMQLASEVADSDWYCIASGQKRGPLEFRELQDLALQGKLRDRDRVWRGSAPKWKKAAEVKGLMSPE